MPQYPLCCVPGDLNLCSSLCGGELAFRSTTRLTRHGHSRPLLDSFSGLQIAHLWDLPRRSVLYRVDIIHVSLCGCGSFERIRGHRPDNALAELDGPDHNGPVPGTFSEEWITQPWELRSWPCQQSYGWDSRRTHAPPKAKFQVPRVPSSTRTKYPRDSSTVLLN
jgi:hypothetical protein